MQRFFLITLMFFSLVLSVNSHRSAWSYSNVKIAGKDINGCIFIRRTERPLYKKLNQYLKISVSLRSCCAFFQKNSFCLSQWVSVNSRSGHVGAILTYIQTKSNGIFSNISSKLLPLYFPNVIFSNIIGCSVISTNVSILPSTFSSRSSKIR